MGDYLTEHEYFKIKMLGKCAGMEERKKLEEREELENIILSKDEKNMILQGIANEQAIAVTESSGINNKFEVMAIYISNFMIPDDEAFLDIHRALSGIGEDRYRISSAYFMDDGITLAKWAEMSRYKDYVRICIEETQVENPLRRASALYELDNIRPTLGELCNREKALTKPN